MAETTISGQIAPKTLQAVTSIKGKTTQQANSVFDILLALLQSGELSGKIIPGANGQFEIAIDDTALTGAGGAGKKTVKAGGLVLGQNSKQAGGADPELPGASGQSTQAEKAAVVNLIASLSSGGKAAAGQVPASAAKADSPALIKAMSGQDGKISAAAGNPEKYSAAVKAGTNMTAVDDLKSAAAKQDGKNFRADLADAAGQKGGISAAPPEQARPGRDAAGEKNRTAAKAAEADNSSGLKSAIQDAAVRGAESAGLHKGNTSGSGAEDFRARLGVNTGEKTAARAANAGAAGAETAKAAARDENGASALRAEPADGAMAGRGSGASESSAVKGAENRADREAAAAPRGETARPGQALSGGMMVQGTAAGSNALSSGDGASGADFNQAVMEQVSGGTIELYRNGGGRVRLSLNPPELGSVDMDLVVDRNGMKLVLFSDSGDVRNVLQANMDQLRGSLHDQGMSRFDILVQDRPASDSSGWPAGGGSGRESMFGGSGSDSGQFHAGGGNGHAAGSRPADSGAAIAASRENSSGELSVFA